MMSISEATIDSMIKDLPFPSNIINTLREDVLKAGVSKKEMEEIIEQMMEEYDASCIEPCDAAGVRITSYNVCYTKLLRPSFF